MPDHQLKFKDPGFDARGWMTMVAAIIIVALIAAPSIWR
jgi:hypothetical protein